MNFSANPARQPININDPKDGLIPLTYTQRKRLAKYVNETLTRVCVQPKFNTLRLHEAIEDIFEVKI